MSWLIADDFAYYAAVALALVFAHVTLATLADAKHARRGRAAQYEHLPPRHPEAAV